MNVSLIVRGVTQRIRFHIEPALSFVPGRARAAERLLADDGAGRLVVHVEVPGRVAQPVLRLLDGGAILREHRAGEPVRASRVDQVERVAPALLVVDVRRHDRAEQLVAQEPEVGVPRLDHRRLDEVAPRVVGAAARDDLRVGMRASLPRSRRAASRSELPSMTAPMKFPKSADVADLDRRDLLGQPLAQRRPQVRRRVDARRGRALLALVLERAAHDRGRERVEVGRRVGDDEVLAAGLADDPRVVAVAADVLADRLPHAVEHGGRAGEVDAGEVAARERRVADLGPGAVDEVDDAVREAGLLRRAASGSGRESIAVDAGFHTTMLPISAGELGRLPAIAVKLNGETANTNPSSGRYSSRFQTPGDEIGLLRVDPRHELDVEAQEVDQLAGGVDLRLVRGLRLAEHRRRVERVAPRPGEQLGRAQEDARRAPPTASATSPCQASAAASIACATCSAPPWWTSARTCSRVVRHHGRLRVAGRDVLAADHERHLDPLATASARGRACSAARSGLPGA